MTIEEMVLEKLRKLPTEQQEEVLKFVESLLEGSNKVPQAMKPMLEEVRRRRAERLQKKNDP